jgi:tetratricopeptide (TPR) repeat protein
MRSWSARGIEPLPQRVHLQAVAVGILFPDDTNTLLRRIPALVDASAERLAHVEEWLRDATTGMHRLLAEVVVTAAFADDAAFQRAVLSDLPSSGLVRTLFILGYAAWRSPVAQQLLRQVVKGMAVEDLSIGLDLACYVGRPLDTELAAVIENVVLREHELVTLDQEPFHDGDVPLSAAALLRHRLRLPCAERSRVDLMVRLTALLREIGEFEEGVWWTRKLVRQLRALVKGGENESRVLLGRALDHQAAMLHDLGQNGKAVGVSREALALVRELCAGGTLDPGRLCLRLGNHGAILNGLGKHDAALEVLHEAVTVGRSAPRSTVNDTLLAHALSTSAVVLFDLGHAREAIESGEESVDRYRELISAGEYLDEDLARALTTWGGALVHLGESSTAVRLLTEATVLLQQIVPAKPHMDVWLLDAMTNLGSGLNSLARFGLALPVLQEASRVAKMLVARDKRYMYSHVSVLCNLGHCLSGGDRHETALRVLRQAVEMAQMVAGEDRRHWPVVAGAHHNFGVVLGRVGQHVAALASFREATLWWRRLSRYRARYQAEVINSLYCIALTLEHSGDGKETIETYTEVARLAREMDGSRTCGCHHATHVALERIRMLTRGGFDWLSVVSPMNGGSLRVGSVRL